MNKEKYKCKDEEVNRLQEDITAVIYQENEKAFAENWDAVCASTEYLGDKIAERLYTLGYRKQVWHKVEDELPAEPGMYYVAYRQSPNNWNMYDVSFYEANSDKKYKWINHLDDIVAWTELSKYEE